MGYNRILLINDQTRQRYELCLRKVDIYDRRDESILRDDLPFGILCHSDMDHLKIKGENFELLKMRSFFGTASDPVLW